MKMQQQTKQSVQDVDLVKLPISFITATTRKQQFIIRGYSEHIQLYKEMLGLHLKVDMTETHRPIGYYHCITDNISKQWQASPSQVLHSTDLNRVNAGQP